MKKILAIMLAMAATAAIQAQDPRPRMHRHDPVIQEKLKFSEEQKLKMKTLNEDFRKKLMDLKKNEDITVREWKKQMETLQKQHREDMQGLLSKEQKAQMEKFREQRRQLTDVNARARMERMKIQLDLNKEQMNKLQKNREEMKQKMKDLHENQSLNMEKKREEMRELMKKQREEMKSILNEEQLKKLQEQKRHRFRGHGQLS